MLERGAAEAAGERLHRRHGTDGRSTMLMPLDRGGPNAVCGNARSRDAVRTRRRWPARGSSISSRIVDERGLLRPHVLRAASSPTTACRRRSRSRNLSRNTTAGTLRGMHFNTTAHAESKLVRCTRGAIHDVIIDLRPDSPTLLRVVRRRAHADDGRALFVPAGSPTASSPSSTTPTSSTRWAPFYAARGRTWAPLERSRVRHRLAAASRR